MRNANNDPRLSLQERYGSHDGYVDAVRKAAGRAKESGFLLDEDAASLVRQAEASAVLRQVPEGPFMTAAHRR